MSGQGQRRVRAAAPAKDSRQAAGSSDPRLKQRSVVSRSRSLIYTDQVSWVFPLSFCSFVCESHGCVREGASLLVVTFIEARQLFGMPTLPAERVVRVRVILATTTFFGPVETKRARYSIKPWPRASKQSYRGY